MSETATGESTNQDTPQNAEASTDSASTSDTRSDLDTLLDEAEAAGKESEPAKTEPKQDNGASAELAALRAELAEVKNVVTSQSTATALESTIKAVRGSSEVLEGVSDEIIEAVLKLEADKDPRIGNAFESRSRDPAAWAKIEKSLGDKIASKFEAMPNAGAAQERRAAVEASRGVTTSEPVQTADSETPSNADLSKMGFHGMKQLVAERNRSQ